MRTPIFWYQEETFKDWLIPQLLTPASWIYGMLSKEFSKRTNPYNPPIPVVCVGNLVAGGAGKTPTVIHLAKLLQSMGKNPHVISRGYGGITRTSTKVDITKHTAYHVGDEPFMIAKNNIICWVGSNRRLSAHEAYKGGADIILMDDGHQNYDLIKDLSIIVVDGLVGFGNGKIIPAGPLRENINEGLARADVIILIGDDLTGIEASYANKKIFKADFEPTENAIDGQRIFGFAGMGRPEKFMRTMYLMGAEIAGFHTFPDHYPYKKIDLEEILKVAKRLNAKAVTTRKDFMRIPPEYHLDITPIDVTLEIEDEDGIKEILSPLFSKVKNEQKA